MINHGWNKSLSTGLFIVAILLPGCQFRETYRGQQYQCWPSDELEQMDKPCTITSPLNINDYIVQIHQIARTSPHLYQRYHNTFNAVQNWLLAGANIHQLSRFDLTSRQMKGVDNFGNVQFTGYHTPVIPARHTPQGEFRYPLYSMPDKKYPLPDRAAIYAGALNEPHLIIAWTRSLLDNFIMEIQGSGYVDFEDSHSPTFLAYAGRNGHTYRSIGKVLIEKGEVARKEMSLQAIRNWADNHSDAQIRELLEQNPSFIFFQPAGVGPVTGASNVPLITRTSAAADPLLLPAGTTLLAEVPLLDNQGKFTGQHKTYLMIVLDVGSAITGHHLDIYQGTGHEAEQIAGFFNHYGRVWILQAVQKQ